MLCLLFSGSIVHADNLVTTGERQEDAAIVPPGKYLTLAEVAQRVVLTNPEVLAKWHIFKSAKTDVDASRAAYYPRVDVTSAPGQEQITRDTVADVDYFRTRSTLSLSQVLFDGFGTSSDVDRLDKTRLVRYFELMDTAEAAALEASRAYLDVLRYRQLVYLAENNYIEHRQSYEQLLLRAQAGAGKRVDVETAAGRLALAELNLNTEAANLHDVMARFMRIVGIAAPDVMFPPGKVDRGFPSDEGDALELGRRLNYSLRAAIEQVEAAQAEVELRRSAYYPRVDLKLRTEYTTNYEGTGTTRRNDVAEVLFAYNLFNGGADKARVEGAIERRNQALDLREKACRDSRQTLAIAYNDVSRLRNQLSNLGVQVAAVEKTRNAYKAQFNIGQRSLLDLLDTESELLNARRTTIHADFDLYLAYLRTHAGIGRLLKFLKLRSLGDDDVPGGQELTKVDDSEICPPDAPSRYTPNIEQLSKIAVDTMANTGVVSIAAGAPLPAGSVANPQGSVAPLPGAAPPPSKTAAVAERFKAWTTAWAARDLKAYLDFYAPNFVPEGGISRADWVTKRTQRLAQPGKIDLAVSKVQIDEKSTNLVVTTFIQDYRSDKFSDRTQKTLRWTNIDGKWLITSESASASNDKAEASTTAEKAKP